MFHRNDSMQLKLSHVAHFVCVVHVPWKLAHTRVTCSLSTSQMPSLSFAKDNNAFIDVQANESQVSVQ